MSTHHATNAVQLTLALILGALLALAPTSPLAATQSKLDGFIAQLEGGWAGEENMTPFGNMGFAALFERQADGSLYSRSPLNSETYIGLRFEKDDTGRWILHEEAGMEGMEGQSYTLVPAEGENGMYRWIYEQRPGFLTIDVGLEDDTMLMEVILRGREHVRFALDRLSDNETAALRQEFLTAAKTPPGEGNSIRDVVERFPTSLGAADSDDADDPIVKARQDVANAPEDASARLTLAKALGEAINSDPMNAPIYAGEMYQSLKTSIKLDPRLAEAYHWLVGYYLNAPPIAGGSVALAEETALQLAEFDAEGARPLLEEIASRKAALQ